MYIINRNSDVAVMRLYGAIGYEVNGNEFAKELASLDGSCKRIEMRINSGGGSVVEGFSIVSAMLSMSTTIHAYIDGLAASMAGVIAMAANKVYMMDYAQFMMHNPSAAGVEESELTDKDREVLVLTKVSLQKILSRRGFDETRMGELMTAETWLSAEKAKEMGICDEIISSRKSSLKNIHPALLAARVSAEFKTTKQNNKMDFKLIAAYLGLAAGIDEQGVVDALKERDAALEGRENSLIDHYMAIGRKNGVITDENKERYMRLAKADFELFVEQVTVEKIKEQRRLSNVIDKAVTGEGKGDKPSKESKTWDWYQRHDPEYLRNLEHSSKSEFDRLLDEYENSL